MYNAIQKQLGSSDWFQPILLNSVFSNNQLSGSSKLSSKSKQVGRSLLFFKDTQSLNREVPLNSRRNLLP